MKKTIEQKKSDILHIATKLFAEQGYEATTIAQVAKLAHVSFGSVSTYFKNKEQLLYMCVKEPMESFLEQLLQFDVAPAHFHKELEKMTAMHIHLFDEKRVYLLLLVQIIAQHEKYHHAYLIAHEAAMQLTNKIELLLTNGQKANALHDGDANTIAVSYISLLFGLYLSNTEALSEQALARFAHTSVRLFGVKDM